MSIYLIRHGQTNGNRDRIVQTPDTPLSDLGQHQAQLLANRFSHIKVGKILCSDYRRTQQTAAPLLAVQKASISLEPLLRERSFGDLRGRAYDDIDADFFAKEFVPPNGETHPQFIQRVGLAWQVILQKHQETQGSLVVMTHGLVLRELVTQFLKVDEGVLPLSDYQNTCITEVSAADIKTVLNLCDAEHLGKNSEDGAAV